MKRALTGAILIHAAAIVFAATAVNHPYDREFAYFVAAVIGFIGLIALIAAVIKKDVEPKS